MRAGTEDQIELLLLRHGATRSNEEGRYLGRTDESLSGAGKEKLLYAKDRLVSEEPDKLFCGPMRRCLETADLLFAKPPFIIPEWTEMDFGAFEGKNHRELDGNAEYQAWIDSGGTLPFPEGESREEFILRSMQGFDRMMRELSGENETRYVAAVVHGGTIMAVLSSLTGREYFDFQVPNGEGFMIRYKTNNTGDPVLSEIKRTA